MVAAKYTGFIVNPIVGQDVAEHVVARMEDGTLYIIGTGSATRAIMERLALPSFLFGVDVVLDKQLIATNVTEGVLWNLIQGFKGNVKIIVTIVAGQNNVYGWDNQQISSRIIRYVGQENIVFLSDETDPASLSGKPLCVETGDSELDEELCSVMEATAANGN